MPDLQANSATRTTIDAPFVTRLLAGEHTAWHTFLAEQHGVFVRAVQTAAWRQHVRIVRDSLSGLVDDAKTHFYGVFRRNFRDFTGEGALFAFVFATVANFLREETRNNRRAFAPLDDDGGEDGGGASSGDGESMAVARHAVDQWVAASRGPDPRLLEQLQQCLLRLPQEYRAVVLMHFFQDERRPLRALAAALGATIDAIHKRFQRALQRLRDCMAGAPEPTHAS
ncbi:MAG: hypothetical protein MUC36_18300 [Planctomycetes bacterium]|jgi:DNA-directed RNA polymerase specialized sigma24 family protein|nr:hypothetical protein [Planctomycetota bacterium]